MNCVKCQGEMEQGFIANHVMRRIEAPVWYAGAFERSFWSGLSLGKRKRFYVQTWRCAGCGYLEAYAQ